MDGFYTKKLLILCAALSLFCAEAQAKKLPSPELIRQLSDNEKAPSAVAKIVKMGPRALGALSEIVTEHESMVARGWAVVSVARIGGSRANKLLDQWRTNPRFPELIRSWAAAARIESAHSFREIQNLYGMTQSNPALLRPWNKRVREIMVASGKIDGKDLEKVLGMINRNPQLRSAMNEYILKQPTKKLAKIMLHSHNTQSRRMAAAYLGTQANAQGVEKVAEDLVDLYRYRSSARSVPWKGGALYVPGIKWPQREARILMSHLIRWLRYTEDRGLRPESRQLINNLRSVGLHRAARVRLRGRRDRAQTYFDLLEQL